MSNPIKPAVMTFFIELSPHGRSLPVHTIASLPRRSHGGRLGGGGLGAGAQVVRSVVCPAGLWPLICSAQNDKETNPGYLLFATAGTCSFENNFSSNLGFTTILSMMIFSGGTGVSLKPSEFLPTGRTLVSKRKGILRPSTVR